MTRGRWSLCALAGALACTSPASRPVSDSVGAAGGSSGARDARGAAHDATSGPDAAESFGASLGPPCSPSAPGRVCLRAGIAQVGRVAGEQFFAERPARAARLRAFEIDRDEVSAAAYAQCVARGACPAAARCAGGAAGAQASPEGPARCVSWADARAYCASVGGRLPTEAEWERAAAGVLPEHRGYPWGELDAGAPDDAAADAPPAPFTLARDETPEGVRAMGGGVSEWVHDVGAFYLVPAAPRSDAGDAGDAAREAGGGGGDTGAVSTSAPSAAETAESETADSGLPEAFDAGLPMVDDPHGPREGPWRVARGGHDGLPITAWTTTRRTFRRPGDRLTWIGFRCAYDRATP